MREATYSDSKKFRGSEEAAMATRGKLDCGNGGDGVLGGDQMALEEAEATKAV